MAAYKDLIGQKITKVTSNPGEPKTGQMWYNSTNGKLRGLGVLEAFSSGAPLATGRFNSGAGGTTSATWIAGGYEPSASNKTEEFNGTGFSSGGNLNTARGGNIGTGVQTAGLTMGGGPGSSPYTSAATEEYDGSSWTTISPGLNSERLYSGAGGTQTAGVIFSGQTTPNATVRSTATEEYNGSSWTTVSGGNVNSGQGHLGGCGTQTAALKAGGDDPGGSSNNSEEYNGSTWTTGNNLNTARRADGTSGIQTQALVVGGYAPPGAKSVVESYDGTSFTETVDLATAQYYNTTSGNTNGTGILSMGGTNPSVVTTVEEYNKSTNTITAAAWASGGALNTGRHNLAGTGTQTAGLAFGGTPPVTGKTEEYNGTAWTESGDLNTARDSFHGFGTQTAAVGAGGYFSPSPGFKDLVEEYDGSSWTAVTALPATRAQHAAAGVLTAGLVFGGHTGSPYDSVLSTTVEYDGTNWTSGGSLNNGTRYLSGAGTSQSNAIRCGGEGSPTAATEEYNGTAWSNGGALNTGRHSAAASGNQTDALYFGGNPNRTNTEAYDGTSWVTSPNLATGREDMAGSTTGTASAALQFGGSPGQTTTQEFTPESTAGNVKDFTTS